MLRIIFMGTPDFAVPSLEKLNSSDHEILAVVSNEDKRRGRGKTLTATPVKEKALELELPVIEVDSLTDAAFENRIKQLNPDLLVVVAFRILPTGILDIPSIGSVNLHASLLPKYRGAAPIHWAVINGESKTGCTVFFLNEYVDRGEIINQVDVSIGSNDTTGDLYEQLKISGAKLLLEAVDQIDHGKRSGFKQDDKLFSAAPKLFTENTKIDFRESAQNVHNKIRGLSPVPGAWTMYENKRMTLYRSRIGPDVTLAPGHMSLMDQKLIVGCGDGTVELIDIQLPGSKKMSGHDFANGYDLGNALL